MRVGLRIDVDTFRGTREGVPRLLDLLAKHGVHASFFFSVGPDNMGRHLWRLITPTFLYKMLRSRALSLYGWDILLAGTAWPGRHIGQHLGTVMRAADTDAHEVGLHAWDHYGWQTNIDYWSNAAITMQLQQGVDTLSQILGRAIRCSAVAGWRADQRVVEIKQPLQFDYNSDCRGVSLFRPRLLNGTLGTIQVPVSLPTFDEVVGRGITADRYNEFILNAMQQTPQRSSHQPPCSLPHYAVYTVHAEAEGIALAPSFDQLLSAASAHGIHFCPLGAMVADSQEAPPAGRVVKGCCPGRVGWVGYQQAETV